MAAACHHGPARSVPSLSFCRQLIPVNARSVSCDAAVTDLAPLVGLTHLEELVIHSSVLEDLTPLAGLTRLRLLEVPHSRVRDIAPLLRLPRLERVNLSGTEVSHDQVEELIHHVPACRVLTEVWIEP